MHQWQCECRWSVSTLRVAPHSWPILNSKNTSSSGYTIQCYQCDSNEDETCPADRPFDKNINAMVNCGGFEAKVPGTFCLKVYQESPGCKFSLKGIQNTRPPLFRSTAQIDKTSIPEQLTNQIKTKPIFVFNIAQKIFIARKKILIMLRSDSGDKTHSVSIKPVA